MQGNHRTVAELAAAAAPVLTAADGDGCAHRGCGRPWELVRVTSAGFKVAYCPQHYATAGELFDGRIGPPYELRRGRS